ncbi:MAG: ribbon-helix-helix domain-containing protein [Candidatus Bathyarchaeia archaeon]
MAKKELVNLNVRVPATLKELLEQFVRLDLHTNVSEFTRDALREKLARDAPELYKKLFQEER